MSAGSREPRTRRRGFRAQPPVVSPIPPSILVAPVAAAFRAGAERAELSRMICRELGAADALLLDSGTSALRLAIQGATKGGAAGPVALPAYCCYDVATAAIGSGARVLLYDIDPRTLGPDLESLTACLSRGAAAVVLVHLYGFPVVVEAAQALARANGAAVIVDAAQAMGADLHGRPAAAWGDYSILSFGRGKGLTGGSGGALVARGERAADVVAEARERTARGSFGVASWLALVAQWLFGRPRLYWLPESMPFLALGETRYWAPWEATTMGSISAVAVRRAWMLVGADVETRRGHARRLSQFIGGKLKAIEIHPDARPSFLRLPVLAEPAVAQRVSNGEWRAAGIARGYPLALCDLPPLASRLVAPVDECVGARELAQELITLPTHGLLEESDLVDLAQWLSAMAAGSHD